MRPTLRYAFTGILVFTAIFISHSVYSQKNDLTIPVGRSYMWVDTKPDTLRDTDRPIAFADPAVRNAVKKQLEKNGWQEVNQNADILISYEILTERQAVSVSKPAYGQPLKRVYFNPATKHWGSVYYSSQFEPYQPSLMPVKKGTVTITISDALSDQTIWQGWSTESLKNSIITEDEISKNIRYIFRRFDGDAVKAPRTAVSGVVSR
jgi:hypothetical protein